MRRDWFIGKNSLGYETHRAPQHGTPQARDLAAGLSDLRRPPVYSCFPLGLAHPPEKLLNSCVLRSFNHSNSIYIIDRSLINTNLFDAFGTITQKSRDMR